MEILSPCRSETPKNIETKIGLNDYVIEPTALPVFLRKSVQLALLPILLKYTLLVTLGSDRDRVQSFPLFLTSPTAKTGGHIFTMYTSNQWHIDSNEY